MMVSALKAMIRPMHLLDAVDDPIVLLSGDGTVLNRNRAARLRLPGASRGETLLPPGSGQAERLVAYLSLCAVSPLPFPGVLELADGPERLRFRCRGARVEGGEADAQSVLLHLLPECDHLPGSTGEGLDGDGVQFAEGLIENARLRGQNERERDQVLIRLYRASHEERLRLARDLHDQTGQHIVGLALGIRALEKHVTTPVGLAEIQRLRERLDDVAQELHRIAFELRPTALDDFGLSIAVRRLLADWGMSHGIATDFQETGVAFDLASEVEITLFRMCQEALTNVSKHAAGVRNVSVAIQYDSDAVSLIVEDDGAGCAEDDLSTTRLIAREKFGIVGMRERIGLVAGSFEIESSPGNGTTLVARIGHPERRT
jgi:signal transduction histidine kinase